MINTTTGKAIAALGALGEIRGQKIDKDRAKSLFTLRKQLSDSQEFFMEQLDAACERLGVEMINGSVSFGEDTDKRDAFLKEVADIEGTAITIDMEPVDLSDQDIQISEEFLEKTDGFVTV